MYMACSLWCWQNVILFHTHESAQWCGKYMSWSRKSDVSIVKFTRSSFLLRPRMAQILRCCVGWLQRRVGSYQLIVFGKRYSKCNVRTRTRHLRRNAIVCYMHKCIVSKRHVNILHNTLIHHNNMSMLVKSCNIQKIRGKQCVCHKIYTCHFHVMHVAAQKVQLVNIQLIALTHKVSKTYHLIYQQHQLS